MGDGDQGERRWTFGMVLGALAEALALKTWMYDEADRDKIPLSARTIRRYFEGEFLESREDVFTIFKLFISQLTLDVGAFMGLSADSLMVLLQALEQDWAMLLDRAVDILADVEGEARWERVLRFLIPSLALRGAAWVCRVFLHARAEGTMLDPCYPWFGKHAFGSYLEAYSEEGETWSAMADRLERSTAMLHNWRRKGTLPTNDSLEGLAAHLVPSSSGDHHALLVTRLRAHRASSFFFQTVAARVGEATYERARDLFTQLFFGFHLFFLGARCHLRDDKAYADLLETCLFEGQRCVYGPVILEKLPEVLVALQKSVVRGLEDGETAPGWCARGARLHEDVLDDLTAFSRGVDPTSARLVDVRTLRGSWEGGAKEEQTHTPSGLRREVAMAAHALLSDTSIGLMEEGIARLERLLARDHSDAAVYPECYGVLAQCYTKRMKAGVMFDLVGYVRGYACYTQAMEGGMGASVVCRHLALHHLIAGALEEAERCIMLAREEEDEAAPLSMEDFCTAGMIAARLGKVDEALTLLEEANKRAADGFCLKAIEWRAALLVACGREGEVARLGEHMVQRGRWNPRGMGRAHCQAYMRALGVDCF